MAPLFAVLLTVQAVPAGGHDWWYVTVSGGLGDQNAHYADRASIRRIGNRVRVDEAREAERVEEGSVASRLGMEYDCQARTGRIVTFTHLGENGRVLNRGNADETLHSLEPAASMTIRCASLAENPRG